MSKDFNHPELLCHYEDGSIEHFLGKFRHQIDLKKNCKRPIAIVICEDIDAEVYYESILPAVHPMYGVIVFVEGKGVTNG